MGLFERFRDVVEFDGYFEFSPAGFVDLEGGAGCYVFDCCLDIVRIGLTRDGGAIYFVEDLG